MIEVVKRDFVKKGFLLLFLIFSFIVQSKTRINVDGSININWGRDRNRRDRDRGNYWENENDGYSYVGDITDNQYNLKPFILNGKGYAIIKDRQYYILQVTFRNGNIDQVDKEVVYNTQIFSQNCIAIEGDSRYCLTITSEGSPALWDRYSGRVKYTGRWLKTTNYYNSNRFDYDYYQNQSEHWFEW